MSINKGRLVAVTLFFVACIMCASFTLSFDAVRDVASKFVKPSISWLVPLIVDMAMIVFSLVRLYAIAAGERQIVVNGLIVLFTIVSIFFNVNHTGISVNESGVFAYSVIGIVLAVLNPVVLLASSECLFWILHVNSKQANANSLQVATSIREGALQEEIATLHAREKELREEIAKLSVRKRAVEVQPESTASVARPSVLDYVKDNPYATQTQIATAVGRSRPTVAKQLLALLEQGLISRNGHIEVL